MAAVVIIAGTIWRSGTHVVAWGLLCEAGTEDWVIVVAPWAGVFVSTLRRDASHFWRVVVVAVPCWCTLLLGCIGPKGPGCWKRLVAAGVCIWGFVQCG